MSSIESKFIHSMLSVASYVEFEEGKYLSDEIVEKSLSNNGDWNTNSQKIKFFVKNFSVAYHQPDTELSDFSATIFKLKESDFNRASTTPYIFSARGTAGMKDILDADIDGIVRSGIPKNQVLELKNLINKLKTPLNQPYEYTSRNFTSEFGFGPVRMGEEITTELRYDGLGLSEIFQSKMNSTGHSLGGNLAAAYGRLFPELVNDYYSYNSAGTAGLLEKVKINFWREESNEDKFYKDIGGQSSYNNFGNSYNVFAEDGLEVVTSDFWFEQLGTRIPVNIEYGVPGTDHSSVGLSDSLAIAWLFSKIDERFTLSDYSKLLDSTFHLENYSYKLLISHLGKALYDNTYSDHWTGIYEISEKLKANPIRSKIGILSGKTYSELLDYYDNGSDVRKKAVIFAINNAAPFTIEKNLASYNQIDLEAYKTDTISALLQMHRAKLDSFENDRYTTRLLSKVPDLANASYQTVNDIEVTNRTGFTLSFDKEFKFGNSENNTLVSEGLESELFGFLGDDKLNGGAKNDLLDGGSGNDELKGLEGVDTLIGGKGDDTLVGGKDSDILWGGQDFDTYEFDRFSGNDTIENIYAVSTGDIDGEIKFEGHVIDGTGAKKKSKSSAIFYDKDNGVVYSLIEKDLTIEFEVEGKVASSVTVRGFKNGNLGINLPIDSDEVDEQEDNTTSSITLTDYWNRYERSESIDEYMSRAEPEMQYLAYSISDNESDRGSQLVTNDTEYRSRIVGHLGDDRLIGGNVDDKIWGGSGNDYLAGRSGDDNLVGDAGSDYLDGGDGADMLKDGDHFIKDMIWRNEGVQDDEIPYTTREEFNAIAAYRHDRDTLIGGIGDDDLRASRGDDYLNGGEGEDRLIGGAHNDRLEGGAGDDVILADGMWSVRYVMDWSDDDKVLIQNREPGNGNWNLIPYIENAKEHAGDDTINGGDGDDYIVGGAGNDVIYGGDGKDQILADGNYDAEAKETTIEVEEQFNGDDIVYAGAGDDKVIGYGGDDTIDGGADNDELIGDHEDMPEELHGKDIIKGGAGDDKIRGNGEDDRLYGGAGKDIIGGDKGNDYLEGNEGDDELQGGEGDDRLLGNADNDVLFGEKGNDYLDGGSGDDKLVGGEGKDILIGGLGKDELWGSEGEDRLSGGSGDDKLDGGAGNDILAGNSGIDRLDGGAGNDIYIANIGDGTSYIVDESGTNTIRFGAGVSAATLSVMQMDTGIEINYGAGDRILLKNSNIGKIGNLEFINGQSMSMARLLNDLEPKPTTSTSTWMNASINDLSYSRENNSLIVRYTGENADWINTAGLDVGRYLYTMETVTENGKTYQQIRFINWFNADASRYLNSIHLPNGRVDLTDVDYDSSNFEGSEYSDSVTGSINSDFVSTGGGNDIVEASGGDDEIIAGAGNDRISGGAGNDTYYFNIGDGQDVIRDSSGNDRIIFGEGIKPSLLKVSEKPSGLLIELNDTGSDSILIANWSNTSDDKIESFVFTDGTVLSSSDIESLIQGNRAPKSIAMIEDQTIAMGEQLEIDLSNGLFSDPDGDKLSYQVSAPKGQTLPTWLQFNSETGVLTGRPDFGDIDSFDVVVIVTDTSGFSTSQTFSVSVSEELGYLGTNGDDVIMGTDKVDKINALAGNDIVNGKAGNDIIIGGKGDDRLYGNFGNDTFIFSLNDGVDTVTAKEWDFSQFTYHDIIKFNEGISSENIKLTRGQEDFESLVIDYGFIGDQVIVQHFFDGNKPRNSIDKIVFSNGVEWDVDTIIQKVEHTINNDDNKIVQLTSDSVTINALAGDDRVYGNDGDDHLLGNMGDDLLSGSLGSDLLEGGPGEDRLFAGLGNDTLIGGEGNDRIEPNGGNNLIQFSKGHGMDLIKYRLEEGQDVIYFDETIDPADIEYYRYGDHMVISTGDENYVIVEYMFGRYVQSKDIRENISLKIGENQPVALKEIEITGGWFDLKKQQPVDTRIFSVFNYEHGYMGDSNISEFENRVKTPDGNSVVYGSDQNDSISTGYGDDLVRAGAGDDRIDGKGGVNRLYPGEGNDRISASGTTYLYLEENAGNDSVSRASRGLDNLFINLPKGIPLDSLKYSLGDNSDDIMVSNFNRDLNIEYGNSGETITLDNMLKIEDDNVSIKYEVSVQNEIGAIFNEQLIDGFLSQHNFAPKANDDTGYSVASGKVLELAVSDILSNDFDMNSDELSIGSDLSSENGSVELDAVNAVIRFTPNSGFVGQAVINYFVTDGELRSEESASIAIEVTVPQTEADNDSDEETTVTDGTGSDSGDSGNVDSGNTGSGDVSNGDSNQGDDSSTGDDANQGTGTQDPSSYTHHIVGSDVAEQLYRSNDSDYIEGLGGNDQLFGLGGDDYLDGGEGDDYLDGGQGSDILIGGEGNDQLGGDAGDDILIGGSGDDMYVFKPGTGHDIIRNGIGEDGTDWLICSGDITEDRLIFVRDGDNLIIQVQGSEDQITVEDWFLGDAYRIDYIQPSGGTGIPASEIENRLTESDDSTEEEDTPVEDNTSEDSDSETTEDTNETTWSIPDSSEFTNYVEGTENPEQLYRSHSDDFLDGLGGDDQLFGLGGDDFLHAGAGNDYLDGGAGNDTQFGGAGDDQLGGDVGNDLLVGGAGDDRYVFRPGAGQDIIDNSVGEDGTDWLLFTGDITSDRLNFSRSGNDMVITISNSDDKVTVKNWYLGNEYRIDYIQPSGGSGISASRIETMVSSSKLGSIEMNHSIDTLAMNVELISEPELDQTEMALSSIDETIINIIHERALVSSKQGDELSMQKNDNVSNDLDWFSVL
ncbi:calcium-binding protein [Pleionea sediminis]|uniref:calcium-binding protein n=1 Tax=Pleionea sediminis TaxID=2569479 RepID=UPI001185BEED|nr:calcium-binding protein [Pleionea sediminis]